MVLLVDSSKTMASWHICLGLWRWVTVHYYLSFVHFIWPGRLVLAWLLFFHFLLFCFNVDEQGFLSLVCCFFFLEWIVIAVPSVFSVEQKL